MYKLKRSIGSGLVSVLRVKDARRRLLSMRERVARSDKEVLLQSLESSSHIIIHRQQKLVILSVLLRVHLPFKKPVLSCNQIKLQ